MHLRVSREVLIMDQVQALVNAVEAAQADKGNVVIGTGKPGSGKSKVLREAAEI